MIFVTHDLGVAAQIADKVAVMYAGRIVEYGSGRATCWQPAASLHARHARLDGARGQSRETRTSTRFRAARPTCAACRRLRLRAPLPLRGPGVYGRRPPGHRHRPRPPDVLLQSRPPHARGAAQRNRLTPMRRPACPPSDDVRTIGLHLVRFCVNVGCSDGRLPSDQGAIAVSRRATSATLEPERAQVPSDGAGRTGNWYYLVLQSDLAPRRPSTMSASTSCPARFMPWSEKMAPASRR